MGLFVCQKCGSLFGPQAYSHCEGASFDYARFDPVEADPPKLLELDANDLLRQLLEASEELQHARSELAALRAATRWVPVTERLPEAYHMVLVYDPEAGCNVAVGSWDKTRWWAEGGYGRITHWRELPPAPGKDHGPLTPPKETT